MKGEGTQGREPTCQASRSRDLYHPAALLNGTSWGMCAFCSARYGTSSEDLMARRMRTRPNPTSPTRLVI